MRGVSGVVLVWAVLAASAAAHGPAGSTAPPPVRPGCPTQLDPAQFATADQLFAENTRQHEFGPRPTASPAHRRWTKRIEDRLKAIQGLDVRSLDYKINRQLERKTTLAARGPSGKRERLDVAGWVPYVKDPGSKGVAAELAYLPADQPLTKDLAGKIVVRDFVPGVVPNAAFAALEWWSYDPGLGLTTTIAGNYERDYLGYEPLLADLHAAKDAGLKGLVFVLGFPQDQMKGHYAPYEGLEWPVPAAWVAADAGERLKKLAAEKGTARLTVRSEKKQAPTRTLVARLPGLSDEKIVIQSHTDGMNAIWDNGPVAMVEMAKHFASLPVACRPRTLEFVFTTAHLYLYLVEGERGGGAEQYARQLDREYDDGKIAMVLALEHMGAKAYDPKPRPDGKPGRVLELSGKREPTSVFIGESPALVELVLEKTVLHDVRETIALRGADLPGLRIPPHQNFGGEGGPYHTHLLPTVALVEGPWSLFNPAFGIEAVDRDLLHEQSLLFTDVLYGAAPMPREALGGGYIAERAARDAICSSALATLGWARCEDVGGMP